MKWISRLFSGAVALLFAVSRLQAQTVDPNSVNDILMPPAVCAPGLESGHGLTGGASVYVLKPYQDSNIASVTKSGLATTAPVTTTTNFDYRIEPAFAVWAGYSFGDGLGVRARWFHFDASSSPVNASNGPGLTNTSIGASPNLPTLALPPGANLFGSPGLLLNSGLGQDLLTFTSELRIDTADAELTYTWNTPSCNFIFGGGGRFMSMMQSYHARLNNNLGDGVTSESQSLDFSHNFNGGGVVIDFEANYKIGRTGLALYALGRGSLLVGTSDETTNYTQIIRDPRGLTNGGFFPVNSVISPMATNSTAKVLPITEIELGVEYGKAWGRSFWFVRTAVVNQTYFGAGSASRTDANLSLFGGQLTLGVNY